MQALITLTQKIGATELPDLVWALPAQRLILIPNVDMKIYTDQGQNVFAQSHNSFWPNENAYETTLKYLIKRTPLHHK